MQFAVEQEIPVLNFPVVCEKRQKQLKRERPERQMDRGNAKLQNLGKGIEVSQKQRPVEI